MKEHGLHLSVPKIYETLTEKYLIRSKWKKNKPRGPIPQAVMPRQVIQKEADILLAPALTAEYERTIIHRELQPNGAKRMPGLVELPS